MRQMVEVPDVPDGYDLTSLMLAEHGPTGVLLIGVGLLLWKVVLPILQQVMKNAQELFNQLLNQSKQNNEQLARLEVAVTKSDEGNRAAVASLRDSFDASTRAISSRLEKHEAVLRGVELGHVDHEHRIRGLEAQAGGSGVYRRPAPPSATHD